jgi:hypothetical protein
MVCEQSFVSVHCFYIAAYNIKIITYFYDLVCCKWYVGD